MTHTQHLILGTEDCHGDIQRALLQRHRQALLVAHQRRQASGYVELLPLQEHLYVCMHACMLCSKHACMPCRASPASGAPVRMCACMDTCTSVSMHMHISNYILSIYTHIYTHRYICIQIYVYICSVSTGPVTSLWPLPSPSSRAFAPGTPGMYACMHMRR